MTYGRQSKKHTRQLSRKDRAEERRAARPHPVACDECDSGNVAVSGWHYHEDPEGVEGAWRVPCPRAWTR